MQIPVARWYQALLRRRSRRQYVVEQLPSLLVAQLTEFIQQLNQTLPQVRVQLINEPAEDVFKGLVGSYGKVKDAPAYVAFIGANSDPHVQAKCGYLGEAFILEATALDLATCWVGGMLKSEVINKQLQLSPDEKVFAISPIGHAVAEYSLEERLLSAFGANHQRKTLETLCTGLRPHQWPDWIQSALAAARIAPSAINRQPWRFQVAEQAITVSVNDPKDTFHLSKRLDCGIAMRHMEIGAWMKGVTGTWEFLAPPQVARFQRVA